MRYKVLSLLVVFTLLVTNSQAQFSIQKAVLEIFAGAGFQYIPDAYVKSQAVLTTYPNAIAIYLHNGDSMAIAEESNLNGFYSPAYPQALINRSGTLYSRNAWAGQVGSVLAGAAPVTVSFDFVAYDAPTRKLDVFVKAIFTAALSGDMRFNCVLVEDSVTGIGPGFDQGNADNTTPGHPYYGAGNPIVGIPHPYVARAYLGGAWGTAGVIQGTVAFGGQYLYHYTYTLPANINPYQVSLVGMVTAYDGNNPEDRKILNAELYPQIATAPISGISQTPGMPPAGFSIYPNPSAGQFIIEAERDGEIEITNTTGEVTYAQPVKQGTNQVRTWLAGGSYFAKLKTTHAVVVKPLLIAH